MSDLTINEYTPVDATNAAVVMTLPTTSFAGNEVACEKIDSSPNLVSITGNIRGVPNSTINLSIQYEGLILVARYDGSWWPLADLKTLNSLDGRYAALGATRPKQSVRVCSTIPVNLASPSVGIDGVTMLVGDRVLLTAQSDATTNGIYVYNGSGVAMARTTDANTASQLTGAFVFVTSGSQANSGWELTNVGAVTPGTTAQTWASFALTPPQISATQVTVLTVGTGTYTVPTGAVALDVTAIGPGGGGACGGTSGSGSSASGGAGGGAGQVTRKTIPTSMIPSSVPYTVSGSAAGAASQTSISATGPVNGSNGAPTLFGITATPYVRAGGGQGGQGGIGGASPNEGAGGNGGVGGLGVVGALPTVSGPTGGGGGGGKDASTGYAGGAGQTTPELIGAQISGGVAPGGTGGDGYTSSIADVGQGASGGAGNTAGPGGNGGNGGAYGAGGGGGGACNNNSATGAGGNGGPGLLKIVALF